jgi:exopolysaccharide biosynthesis polyprenyl glycosylphosphotransferase
LPALGKSTHVSELSPVTRARKHNHPQRGQVYEKKRRLLLNALKLLDLTLLVMAFGVATALVVYADKGVSLEKFLSLRVKLSNCAIFALALFVWHVILCVSGLYRSRRLAPKFSEFFDTLKAASLCTLCVGFLSTVFTIRMVTTRFLFLFWILAFVILLSLRLLLRSLLAGIRRRGRNLRYVLILGTNARAIEFANRLERTPERGYRLLGFVDDEWENFDKFKETGYPIACRQADLAEFLRRNVVDEVAFYLPLRSYYEHCAQVAALCEEHGTVMRFATDIFTLKTARARAEEVDGDHFISTSTNTLDGWPLMAKRVLDIAFSGTLIFLLLPLLLAVAVGVKLTSSGPIFFRQERLGLNKRRFVMYKFRTMVADAEARMAELEKFNEVSGPVFKIKNDPRITPVGRILRRTSIDELPQLLNVLKGDMSMVGPRPLPVRDYEGFSEDWQRRRFSIQPGLTCLWQINGRSSIAFEEWMKLDIKYMDEWSLWLDFKILARTIPAVLKGSGAA